MAPRGAPAFLVAAWLACLLIYLPDAGHGFIRDDFMWLRVSQLQQPADIARIFTTNVGFYRPLVTLSFGLDQRLFGIHPLPLALVNIALLLATAYALYALARALRLPPAAGAVAGAVWLLNFHAVNMAVLWLSGRTALLLALFGILALRGAVVGSLWQSTTFFACALLSREDAITLPIVMLAARGAIHGWDRRDAITRAAPLLVIMAAYAGLRRQSGAFDWSNAPDYYAFTISPEVLLRNVLEYADRGATFAVAWTLVAWLAVRRRPALDEQRVRCIAVCGVWFVLAYAVTVFVPIRSSLYALMPSAAASLAAGVVIATLLAQRPEVLRPLAAAALALTLALVPVYRARNERWVAPARLSTRLVADLRSDSSSWPAGSTIVLHENAAEAETLESAFGGLLPDAMRLFVRRDVQAEVSNEPGQGAPPPGTIHYALTGQRLVRMSDPWPEQAARPGAAPED